MGSHYKFEAGTEAALMHNDLEQLIVADPSNPCGSLDHPVFIDTEDLQNLAHVKRHVRRSYNLVLLLTPNVLSRPWVLLEIVTAINHNVRVVPVEIVKEKRFTYPNDQFYECLKTGGGLTESAMKMLEQHSITLGQLVRALKQVFTRIAVPFSPHRSNAIRRAELKDILKHCTYEHAFPTFSVA